MQTTTARQPTSGPQPPRGVPRVAAAFGSDRGGEPSWRRRAAKLQTHHNAPLCANALLSWAEEGARAKTRHEIRCRRWYTRGCIDQRPVKLRAARCLFVGTRSWQHPAHRCAAATTNLQCGAATRLWRRRGLRRRGWRRCGEARSGEAATAETSPSAKTLQPPPRWWHA